MSDEKLIKYIKTVDAKFDSHLGNGTITMSIDYYNLIEELLARGINAIQKKQDFIKWLEDKIDICEGRLDTIKSDLRDRNIGQGSERFLLQERLINNSALRIYQEILTKVKEGEYERKNILSK